MPFGRSLLQRVSAPEILISFHSSGSTSHGENSKIHSPFLSFLISEFSLPYLLVLLLLSWKLGILRCNPIRGTWSAFPKTYPANTCSDCATLDRLACLSHLCARRIPCPNLPANGFIHSIQNRMGQSSRSKPSRANQTGGTQKVFLVVWSRGLVSFSSGARRARWSRLWELTIESLLNCCRSAHPIWAFAYSSEWSG